MIRKCFCRETGLVMKENWKQCLIWCIMVLPLLKTKDCPYLRHTIFTAMKSCLHAIIWFDKWEQLELQFVFETMLWYIIGRVYIYYEHFKWKSFDALEHLKKRRDYSPFPHSTVTKGTKNFHYIKEPIVPPLVQLSQSNVSFFNRHTVKSRK